MRFTITQLSPNVLAQRPVDRDLGANVCRERDQFLDHLRRFDVAGLLATDGLLQHLGERTRLHKRLSPAYGLS